MYEQETRINAAICYFFLGPLFLLAKKWTPFAHPFVRFHAKKSSIFFAAFLWIFFILSGLKKFLLFNILGFSLFNIIFSVFLAVFFGLIIFSSYRAFGWYGENNFSSEEQIFYFSEKNYSEEEKIRIIASFLPIIWIFLAEKYQKTEFFIGRKIWNFFLFLIFLFAIIGKSFLTFPVFIILSLYIAIFVSISVFLMAYGKIISSKYINAIPTYHEFEAFISAGIQSIFDFFRVAFGKEKTQKFSQRYHFYLEKYQKVEKIENNFWTHPAIIGIPFLNIITFPAFFQEKYNEFQGNIAEWFLLTILCILAIFFTNNFYAYLLIFPIATLIAEAKNNANIRAPITSFARHIFIFFYKTKQKIQTLKNNSEEESIIIEK